MAAVLVLRVVGEGLVPDGRHEVEPGSVDVPRASPAEASAALSGFVAGVAARDVEALVSLAPADDSAAAEVLAGIAANAATLDLREVDARYVDQVGTVAPDGSWTGVVELSWRVGGLDLAPSRAEVAVELAPDGDGLRIAGFGRSVVAGGRLPLWLRGELAVSRARDVLVMVDGSPALARAVAQRVARGATVVQRVLPGLLGPVVVEVPASGGALDETLGVRPGTYAGIAAVTATPGSAVDGDAPVHVFVNPDVTTGLRHAGGQVVMSHELVHVATDAVHHRVEPWLLEGFADYVALRDTRLPDRLTLRRAIHAARRDGVPDALPTASDFETRGADLQARYEEAWLACRIIAERMGERGLVEVYDAAAMGGSIKAVVARAGLSMGRLTRDWRERIGGLASGVAVGGAPPPRAQTK